MVRDDGYTMVNPISKQTVNRASKLSSQYSESGMV